MAWVPAQYPHLVGGNAMQGSDGPRHMYLAKIGCRPDDARQVRCSLPKWQTQSQVVHITSPNVDNPYERDMVMLPPKTHNPTLKVSPSDGSWNMYYISGGSSSIDVILSTDEGKS